MFQIRVVCFVFYLILSQILIRTEGVEYVNVALGKPTKQPDVMVFLSQPGNSSLAVDGTRSSHFFHGSCSHTLSTSNTWWIVDLLYSYPIHSIHITNRDNHGERLQKFDIYVSKINPYPIAEDGNLKGELCLHREVELPANGPHSVQCTSVLTGRYVYIWKPGNDELALCEFEVLVPKQNVDWSEMGFYIRPEQKSSKDPFLSVTMKLVSYLDCIRICVSVSERFTTAAQVEKATKMCECIEVSGLDDSEPDISMSGWTLLKSFGN